MAESGLNAFYGSYANSSLGQAANLTNTSAADPATVRLTLGTSQPAYVGQNTYIQLTAWNDNLAPMTIEHLRIRVNDPDGNPVLLSNAQTDNVTFSFSTSLIANFTPNATGNYTVFGEALNESGEPYYDSKIGQYTIITKELSISEPVSVLSPTYLSNPNFTVSFTPSNQKIIYGIQPTGESVVKINSWQRCADAQCDNTPYCPSCGTYHFCTTEISPTGVQMTIVHCFQEETIYSVARVNTLPLYNYDLGLTITNTNGSSISGTLSPYSFEPSNFYEYLNKTTFSSGDYYSQSGAYAGDDQRVWLSAEGGNIILLLGQTNSISITGSWSDMNDQIQVCNGQRPPVEGWEYYGSIKVYVSPDGIYWYDKGYLREPGTTDSSKTISFTTSFPVTYLKFVDPESPVVGARCPYGCYSNGAWEPYCPFWFEKKVSFDNINITINGIRPALSLSANLTNNSGVFTAMGLASSAGGVFPSSNTILLTPVGGSAWNMYDYSKYQEYTAQLSSTRAILSSCNGDRCKDAAYSSVNDLNTKINALLSSSSPSAGTCAMNNNYLVCNATAFIYPQVDVLVNASFIGGHIYTPIFNVTANNICYSVRSR
jgi:hypothetical protein